MPSKRATPRGKVTKLDIIIGIVIAGFIIFSFVRHYMITGAFVLPAGTTSTGGTKPTSAVCSTCAESGQLSPKCAGTCPEGQSCGLRVPTDDNSNPCGCS